MVSELQIVFKGVDKGLGLMPLWNLEEILAVKLTRPQVQDILSQLIFTMTQRYTQNSSYMHRGSLHPHFKM